MVYQNTVFVKKRHFYIFSTLPSKQERAVADVENDIAKDVLEIANTATRVRSLQDILDNINGVISQKNDTISRVENDIVKRNAVIEKKQGTIDQINKRVDSMIIKNGVSFIFQIFATISFVFSYYYSA